MTPPPPPLLLLLLVGLTTHRQGSWERTQTLQDRSARLQPQQRQQQQG
jgi:hypothetical protein